MEIEFKFCIPAERLAGVEAALSGLAAKRTRLQARYYDTHDHRLAAHGMILRLRLEGTRWVQTIKATGQGVLHRLEHNVDLGEAGEHDPMPVADPARHAGSDVGERFAQVLAHSQAPLGPTYETDIWRLSCTQTAHGCTAELALDLGEIRAHPPHSDCVKRHSVRELELELLDGSVQGLTQLALEWASVHQLWFSSLSKAEAGSRLLQEPNAVAAYNAPAPHWTAGQWPTFPLLWQQGIHRALAHLLPNASEIAADTHEDAPIEQLLLALRHLRLVLRLLSAQSQAVAGTALPGWLAALSTAQRQLGALRDARARRTATHERSLAAGGAGVALEAPMLDRSAGDIVRAPGFQAALIELIGLSAVPALNEPSGHPETGGPDATEAMLREALSRLHRRVLRDGARFESLSPPARHRLHARLHKLNALTAWIGPLFDPVRSSRYAAALQPALQHLSDWRDAHSVLALYQRWSIKDPKAQFDLERWQANESAHAQVSLRALDALSEVEPYWIGQP